MGRDLLWTRRPAINVAVAARWSLAVWRVTISTSSLANTWHDARYALGRMTRDDHLARYGDPATRKYSAIAVDELGDVHEGTPRRPIRVYVFGFSSGA